MDQEAHWFVCKDGLKTTCEHSLMHTTITDLGFVKGESEKKENHDSAHGIWYKHSLDSQHPLTVIRGLSYFFVISVICMLGQEAVDLL